MKNKKTLYALIGLVAAAVIFFFVYKQLAPKPAAGTKRISPMRRKMVNTAHISQLSTD